MNEPELPVTYSRYIPTRENFILRVKELLYELALQAAALREQPQPEDELPPDGQESSVMQE